MESSIDRENYFKLQFLLHKASVCLRELFIKRWKIINDGEDWINSQEYAIKFKEGRGRKVYKTLGKLQQNAFLNGDLDLWDFTLIAKILCFFEDPIFDQQNIQLKQDIIDENLKIKKLKQVRNKCAHDPKMSLNEAEFNDLWNEMVAVLVSLGQSEDEMEILKNESILIKNDFSPDINEENRTKANELKQLGNLRFNEGKFIEAIDNYTEALALKGLKNQDKSLLYSNRSASHLKLNKPGFGFKSGPISIPTDHNDRRYMALFDAKQCLELNPIWWRSYYRVGLAYEALNKFEKAIYFLDQALALEPTQEQVISARDTCRKKFGELSREEHLDERSLPRSPAQDLKMLNETGFNLTLDLLEKTAKSWIQNDRPEGDIFRAHGYRDGTYGYRQDYEMAAKFYSKAAIKGNAEGMYNLALLTNKGRGVKEDHKQAIKLLEQAAKEPPMLFGLNNLGVREAQHSLGQRYQEGVGVPKNAAMAAYWYSKASENGMGSAANNLGIFYLNGEGVEMDLDKAEQYFKLAASRKEPNAMENLAYYLLSKGDIVNARIWYKRAIENGNSHAKLYEKDFKQEISMLEQNDESNVSSKWESENGLLPNNLTLQERFDRMQSKSLSKQNIDLFDNLKKLLTSGSEPKLPGTVAASSKFNRKTIEGFAQKRSLIAQRMLTAIQYNDAAISALKTSSSMEKTKKDRSIKFVENFANAIRTDELVATIAYDLIETAIELVNEILKSEGISKSKLDIDARVCYVGLHSNSLHETIHFLKQCTKKYPEEFFFYKLCGVMHGFTKEFKEGLNQINKAIEITPNNFGLMYDRAALMRLDNSCNPEDAINAYVEFLKLAPKDHRKFPESYYAIGVLFHEKSIQTDKDQNWNLSEELKSKIKTFYEQGLDAEKIQLPFFMPYESTCKLRLEIILMENEDENNESLPQLSIVPSNDNLRSIKSKQNLSDPHRIELIRSHREYSLQFDIKTNRGRKYINNTYQALNKQKAPKSLLGLKAITLRDMDPTKDRVFDGYLMEITFIEDAITGGASIRTLVEDENGDIQRCFIYNYEIEDNDYIVQQIFGFGCKMNLMNPYMRMCHDRKPAIRVDDPNSLIKIGNESIIENMCRYCGKENATKFCGRCKRAQYCDRNCQTNDWNIYKHKLICKRAI